MARKPTPPRRKPGASARPKPSRAESTPPKAESRKRTPRKSSASTKRPEAATEKAKPKSTTSTWEAAAAIFGGVIFLVLIGFLVYAGLTRPEQPSPDIVASAGPAKHLPSGTFLVPLSVENLGHDTGANVTVRGSLRDAGGVLVEESSATFDYVAQHSSAEGGLFFTTDPSAGTLTLRVEGYADP